MAILDVLTDHAPVTAPEAGAEPGTGESLADRGLTLAGMVGAVGGAIAGAVLGAEVGSAYPEVCGTLGTMFGGGLAAGGWCLFARLWTGPVAGGHVGRERDHAARPGPVTPTPNEG